MAIRSSGSGCGGFLLWWCAFWGILTFLAGLGHWGEFGVAVPGYWIIALVLVLGVGVVAALSN
jgi:hypothetical protein